MNKQHKFAFLTSLMILSLLFHLGYIPFYNNLKPEFEHFILPSYKDFLGPRPEYVELTNLSKLAYILTLLMINLVISLGFKVFISLRNINYYYITGLFLIFSHLLLPLTGRLFDQFNWRSFGITLEMTILDRLYTILEGCADFSLIFLINLLFYPPHTLLLIIILAFLVDKYFDLSTRYPFLSLETPLIPLILTSPIPLLIWLASRVELINNYIPYLFFPFAIVFPVIFLGIVKQKNTLLLSYIPATIALILGRALTPLPLYFAHLIGGSKDVTYSSNTILLQVAMVLWFPFFFHQVDKAKTAKSLWKLIAFQLLSAVIIASIFLTQIKLKH